MDDLNAGLAATANEPAADSSPATLDATLDAAFDAPSEPAASSDTPLTPDPVDQPVAATSQPQEPAKADGVKGEPPKERWDTILANARTKAREDALAEHRDHLEIVQRLKADLPGTLAQLLEEGSADPRFSEQITARAAAILNARKASAKANEEPQPDAVMRYEDGTTEPTYSPAQLRKWNEWHERQFEAKLMQKFEPVLQLQQQFEKHQQVRQEAEKVAKVTERRLGLWHSAPLFKENMGAIKARQLEIYTEMQGKPGFDPLESPYEALQQAYNEVVQTQALPKLQSQQTQQLVADAARKRAASSSDPAASLPAQPRKPRTVDEALDQAFDAYAGA